MKYTDLNGLTAKDLYLKIKEERAKLQRMKFGHAVTPIENPRRIKNLRRDIARLHTAFNNAKQQAV